MRHRVDCLNTYCKNVPFSIKWCVYNCLYSIPTLTGAHLHLRLTHKRHVCEYMLLHKKWFSLHGLLSLSFCGRGPVTPCIYPISPSFWKLLLIFQVFCCHGGIPPPWLCPVVSTIRSIPCPLTNPDQQSALAWALMWNDPVRYFQNYLFLKFMTRLRNYNNNIIYH